MGITGLWEILGEGEICSIADYASRHFEEHKRPLRIAVDAACWRFNNLTPEQVTKIREGEPAANPVEKVILWRLLRLLKLNIQLLFVNDGMRRPWKRGRKGGAKLDYELVKLSNSLFDHFEVPHHLAPGEAEAECAKLQAAGIVDAVWSDDGDSLMFGCETLIRQHKVNGSRVKDQVRIYRAKNIKEMLDLDADSLVLFAMLAGGDYSTGGLRGCGPKTTPLVARRKNGLARALCHASKSDLAAWRDMLRQCLRGHGKSIDVPTTFPEFRALEHYRSPAVSTADKLSNLRGLRQGWDRHIDQEKLRVFLRDRFNIWTRGFLKHITPIFLSRALAQASAEDQVANLAFGIHRKRTRAKKNNSEDPPARSEVKITFSPLPTLEIDLSQQPVEEDWSIFEEKDGTRYDPTQPIECEVLECLLRHGLPKTCVNVWANSHEPANHERKLQGSASEPHLQDRPVPPAGRKKLGSTSSISIAYGRTPNTPNQLKESISLGSTTFASTSKRHKALHLSERSFERVSYHPPSNHELPQVLTTFQSTLKDFDAESDSSGSDVEIISASKSFPHDRRVSGTEPSAPDFRDCLSAKGVIPDQTTPPETLGCLRREVGVFDMSNVACASSGSSRSQMEAAGPSDSVEVEVIDLT